MRPCITFAEGIENVNVIRSDSAAGFSAKPNPTNDKVHTGVQRLNAARNMLWLLKEKLKSGVVSTDASLMDKLREAQTWLSTQTGGHLGQGMSFALEKAGVFKALDAKWGSNSVKFQSFSAAAGNGLDFLINGYNTVVNSLALHQEVSTANILAVTSSVTAMAGDVTMGVAQVLSTSAKISAAAGPIGYAVAATLFIASYATGVASGLTGQENLEAKDYVKAFLGPLIPHPAFGTTVEMIDRIAKGNVLEFYHLYLTQSLPAALAIGGMFVIDRLTGSSKLEEYAKGIKVLGLLIYLNRYYEFRKEMVKNVASTIRELKPRNLLYAFPHPIKRDHYLSDGWSADDIKNEFNISSELSNVCLFMATYKNEFAKPFEVCPDKVQQGFTFCPEAAPHGDDKLIFMGSTSVNEKVLLDDNCEAYGMGGDDHFVLKAAVVRKGVKINGGNGSDIIDITNTFFGSRSSVTGGGPERDVIKTGPWDDTIVVDNDDVEITNGDNTLIVEGKGNDEIRYGTGADLVLVEKSGGSVVLSRVRGSNENAEQNKPKRIVYKGEGRVKDASENDFISGGPTQFDLLTMRKYSPNTQPQGEERILLIESRKTIDEFMQGISNIRSTFFKGHQSEVSTNGGDMRTKAQRIHVEDIERFEMSESAINMLLVKGRRNDYYEVTGGPKHDFVINLDGATPLLAQMSTGDNRVLSGAGKDSYSVILDVGEDFIFDKGGENILAVLLPQGSTLNDAIIGRSSNGQGYKIERKSRRSRDHRIDFIFLGDGTSDGTVQIIVEDSTGKQITFKPVPRPSLADDFFSQDRSIGSYYYDMFEFCPGDQAVIAIVEGIAPPIGEKLPQPQC